MPIDVSEIYFFDDDIADSNNLGNYIKEIKEKMIAVSEKRVFETINITQDAEVTFFYLQNGVPKKMSSSNFYMEEMEDWIENIGEYLAAETGKLILCDYSWEMYPDNAQMAEYLFNKANDGRNNVFCCYSTVRADEAQNWIDEISENHPRCVIIDMALTLPKNGTISEKIRSIEEAMLDEWE